MSTVLLRNCRLSYNALFEAQDFQGNGDFAYSAKLIIPKDSEAAKSISKALLDTANAEFNGKGKETIEKVKHDSAQFCLQSYDEENYVLATKRKQKAGRPTVINGDRTPLTQDDGKPYAGCFVNAIVRPWAMAGKGRSWIRCGLEGIQFVKDGEPFSKRVSPDDFDDLSNTGDQSDNPEDLF